MLKASFLVVGLVTGAAMCAPGAAAMTPAGELIENSAIVRFAMEPGMLLADPFGGWLTSALAAERNGCRWIATERMRAFLHAAQWRMLNS